MVALGLLRDIWQNYIVLWKFFIAIDNYAYLYYFSYYYLYYSGCTLEGTLPIPSNVLSLNRTAAGNANLPWQYQ